MSLFGKKEEKPCCCGSADAESMERAVEARRGGAGVKILGAGCPKCAALEAAAREALASLGMAAEIDHVTDYAEIAAYGVMTTPALVVDGAVVSLGKVLKPAEVAELLKKARG